MPVKTKIQVRRDTAANWTSTNPTLAAGEQGWETDTKRMKVGDGTTAWTSLAYFNGSSSIISNGGQSTLTGTTAEQTAFSVSLAPTSSTTTYMVNCSGSILNNTGGSVNYTFKTVLGTTTVFDPTLSIATNANRRRFNFTWYVTLAGNYSQQHISWNGSFSGTGATTYPAIDTASTRVASNTSTENMSSAKNLQFLVTVANASAELVVNGFTVVNVL